MKNLSILTGIEKPSDSLVIDNWQLSPPAHTSIDIKTTDVYNIIKSQVVDILENNWKGKTTYIITMKVSDDLYIRYLNLSDSPVSISDAFDVGIKLGTADTWVGVEYCTRVYSRYPVLIGNVKIYKHDPSDFILRDIMPNISVYTFDQIVARSEPYYFQMQYMTNKWAATAVMK